MSTDSFTFTNTLTKGSVYESDSILQAYRDDAASRLGDEAPEAISNERIVKDDFILETYRVEDDAIHGGMGSVWRVHHLSWDTDLAMKRPQPRFFAEGSDRRKEAFISECEHWIDLGLHPNIVSCYYVREIGAVPTIFSEWMDGGSLKDAIQSGRLYEGTEKEVQARILDVAIQDARGLSYSHEKGLIHQDVKPGNILLSKGWDAKVADFGLAAATGQPDKNGLGDGGGRVGSSGYSPAYCSPEQKEGHPVTHRTDLYSWAVTVMEMYRGDRPWTDGVQAGHNCREYLKACRVKPPEGMSKLLVKCMSLDESARPKRFATIEKELDRQYRSASGSDYLRRATANASDTADMLNNRALSFLDLGKAREAEELWVQALLRDVYHVPSLYNLNLYRWRKETFKDEYERRDKAFLLRDRLKTMRENGRLQSDALIGSALNELNGGELAPWQLSRIDKVDALLSREAEWRALCDEMRQRLDAGEIGAAIEQMEKMRKIPGYAFGEEYRRFAVELSRRCAKKALRGVRRSVVYFPRKVNDADISEDGIIIACTKEGMQVYDAYTGAATGAYTQSGNATTWGNRTPDILAYADRVGGYYTMSHLDSRKRHDGQDQDLIRRWNPQTGKCMRRYKASVNSDLRLFQVSEDGERIVGFDGRAYRVYVWSSDSDKYLRKWEPEKDAGFKELDLACFETVDIGADDRSVLCGMEKYEFCYAEGPGAAILWDMEGQRPLRALPVRERSICCKLSRDMRYALFSPLPMANRGGARIPAGIQVVDLKNDQDTRRIDCDGLSAAGLAISETGKFLFASMGEIESRHLGADLFAPRPVPEKWRIMALDFASGEPFGAFDAPRMEKLKLFGHENCLFGYTDICAYVWFLDWEFCVDQ